MISPSLKKNRFLGCLTPFPGCLTVFIGGRHKGYCSIKFGRNRLVNKNFRLLGMKKPDFFQFSRLTDPYPLGLIIVMWDVQGLLLYKIWSKSVGLNKNFRARGD
jgi:hypothetical protein